MLRPDRRLDAYARKGGSVVCSLLKANRVNITVYGVKTHLRMSLI